MHALRQPITAVVIIFWFSFWLLNGLDKFFARQDIGLLRWWGNHRVEKFTMYFDRLSLDPAFIQATLIFAGVVEFAAAAFLWWPVSDWFRENPAWPIARTLPSRSQS